MMAEFSSCKNKQETVKGTDGCIETPLNCKRLIGMTYPGIVKNSARMLESLGGQDKLTKAFNDGHAPVALCFQPGNPYCKPARGVATKTTSMLMKVKHRYRRRKEGEAEGPAIAMGEDGDARTGDEKFSAEILGVLGHKYEFPYMCDFQYLPYERKANGELGSLIEKILPSAGEELSYVDKDVPSFMLPEIFSKFDKPIPYNYKAGFQHRTRAPHEKEREFCAKLIQHGRNKRTNYAQVVTAMTDFEIPTVPHPIAVEQLESQKPGAALDEIKKLFEERPLWSRNALRCNTEISTTLIKGILCVVAYYFQQGPWRGLWCRMGYDPREHFEAKKYQLLDFRIRKELTDKRWKLLLRKKRMILYPHKSQKSTRCIPTPQMASNSDQHDEQNKARDSYYIMRRGILPAYHQMFYQLCDLEDPELQAIINNPQWHRQRPNMKTGYFEQEMFRQLRDTLTQMIKDTVLEGNAKQDGEEGESSLPSTSAAALEGEVHDEDEDEEEEDIGEEDDNDEEDEMGEGDNDDDDGVNEDILLDDAGGEMEGVLDVGSRNVEEEEEEDVGEDEETSLEKDVGMEGIDSDNEMEVEMLEFIDSGEMPS